MGLRSPVLSLVLLFNLCLIAHNNSSSISRMKEVAEKTRATEQVKSIGSPDGGRVAVGGVHEVHQLEANVVCLFLWGFFDRKGVLNI